MSSTTTACAFVSEPLSGLAESPAAPASVAALQPADDLVVNAVDPGDEVLVGGLRSAVADDDIGIGEWVRIRIVHHR